MNLPISRTGLDIRKWYSNSAELRKYMGCANGAEMKKVLGGIINSDDEIVFNLTDIVKYAQSFPVTKRSVLRIGGKTFDPAGFMPLVILVARMYYQKLCVRRLKWNDRVPEELYESWMFGGDMDG